MLKLYPSESVRQPEVTYLNFDGLGRLGRDQAGRKYWENTGANVCAVNS